MRTSKKCFSFKITGSVANEQNYGLCFTREKQHYYYVKIRAEVTSLNINSAGIH